MKSLLHILIFILLLTQQHFPQWTNQNPVPDGNDLESVYFIDDNIGWIVGSGGFIMKTTNTGLDWLHQNSGTIKSLKEVKFIDLESGWAVGDSGTIIKSTDGGLNWISLSSGTSNNLQSLYFINQDSGWAVGMGGTILKTTDGGTSWLSQNVFNHYDLFSVCFVDDTTGWTVGLTNVNNFERALIDSFLILRTTNAGMSWFKQGENLFPWQNYIGLFTVEFIDKNVGYVGGGYPPMGGRVVGKTTNGGESWFTYNQLEKPPQKIELSGSWSGIQDLFFKDINNGYLVHSSGGEASGGIQITTNGGIDWISKFSWRYEVFNSIFVTDLGIGFAVETRGRIFNTDDNGTSWSQQLSGDWDEHLNELFLLNDSVGWVVGRRFDNWHSINWNLVYKTTNSGKIWETQLKEYEAFFGLSFVFFKDEFTGWASGTRYSGGGSDLYSTTDGGENWIHSTTSYSIYDIFFINQDIGWMVTNAGIYKSMDGGTNWIQKSAANSTSVYFIDINLGWAVGGSGSIVKSTDSGETWVSKSSNTSSNLNSVRFYDNNIGMCMGDSGLVLVSTDGGENWISKIGPSLQNFSFINATRVWGATAGGDLYKTTDFGDTWIVLNNGIGGVASFFISENKGWVCQDDNYLDNDIFIYYIEPTAPSSPSDLSASADTFSVTLNWIDNSSNEIGFIIERKDGDSSSVIPYVSVDTLLTGITSVTDTALTHNTTYTYRVFAYNNIGNSDYSNLKQVTTLNVAPSSPTNLMAVADTFSVELNWIDNSDNELGFVIERKDGDSLSVNPYIRIDTVMANINSIADTGLTPNTVYTYRLFAYNSIGNSSYSNLSQITTISLPIKFQLTVSLLDGWNIVSIPGLHPLNQNVSTWWSGKDPSASVYMFNGGYQSINAAELRTGYWLKNSGEQTYSTGDEWPLNGILAVTHDAINANAGWNLIGGYEYNAAVSGITTTPPGLQNSAVYKYSGSYQMADFIIPGYGYWIKLNGNGLINLPEQSFKNSAEITDLIKEDWGRIILMDASGNNITLYAVKGEVDLEFYELPPMPPTGMFDIRFSTNRIAEDINSSIKKIDLSGVTYPLTVTVEGMDMRLMDETGKTVNVNLKSGENIVISYATIRKLMVTGDLKPAAYSLEQNYPNPFNPSTVIEFSLPEDVSSAKLSIYNALGEKAAELVNTSLAAGRYSYQWNAKNVATGMYIYELRTDKFVSVKKMVLMK